MPEQKREAEIRRDLFAVLRIELATPLGAIMGFAEMVAKEAYGPGWRSSPCGGQPADSRGLDALQSKRDQAREEAMR
jgi:signal transduction histidine kinase